MRQLKISIYFFLIPIVSLCQTIPDNEFVWHENPSYILDQMASPIFVKVEIDPVISTIGRTDFFNFCDKLTQKLSLNDVMDGVLKIKLLFHKDGFVIVHRIGTKGVSLSSDQRKTLTSNLATIKEFIPGRQRGQIVNSIGILYLHIKQSAVEEFSCVNFQLRNDL